MKKLLKLLIVLAATTTVPINAVACSYNTLKDAYLKAIYNDEKTDFQIHDLVSTIAVPTSEAKTPYLISNANLVTLAQTAAQKMLQDQGVTETIDWYNPSTAETNHKYYQYQITNGTKNDQDISWDVNRETQEITINLNYLAGTTDSAKKFNATEQISKTIKVKCGKSESDKIVDNWITSFNNALTDDWNNNFTINSTDQKLNLPADGVSWKDISDKWTKIVNSILSEKIDEKRWTNYNSVAFTVKDLGNSVKNNQIEVALSVNKSNSKAETKAFMLSFTKNNNFQ